MWFDIELANQIFDGAEGGAGDAGGAGAGDGGSGAAGGVGDTVPAGAGDDLTVDWGSQVPPEVQKKLNDVIKKEKEKQISKHKKEVETTISQLEQLKKKTSLTEQEKSELESRISEMARSIMTKEQLAAEERTKLQRKYEQDTRTLAEERDSWKNLFTSTQIERSIIDSAIQHEAFQPSDIIALLRPLTGLVEETDATGQKTGRLVPHVKFPTQDSDGKQVTLDLSVPEAVKRMVENEDRYGHLLKTTAKSGLGMNGQTQGGGGTVDHSKLSPEEYRKYREKALAGKV